MQKVSNTQPVPLAHIFTGRNQQGQYMKGCIIPLEIKEKSAHSRTGERRKAWTEKECMNCHSIFYVQPCFNNKKFCSMQCRDHFPWSDERRKQHSESLKGRIVWNKGKHTGQVPWNKGVPMTEEQKLKLRQLFPAERRRRISEAMKGNQNSLGRCHSEGTKKKIGGANSVALKTYYVLHPEAKERLSKMRKGAKHSAEWKWNHSKTMKTLWANGEFLGMSGKHHTDEWTRQWMLSNNIKPNKKERLLEFILQSLCPHEWKYVGDGQLVIGSKCPDFANVNGQKKLIELFGQFWHSEKKKGRSKQEEEQLRIDHFANYGYKTLIVWENELERENLPTLREKLINFADGGS